MKYYLNGKERAKETLKVMSPRKIQEGAICRISNVIDTQKKLLINMPCRSGKTYTAMYPTYNKGVELVIVLCGKRSAKSGYETDSTWINAQTGEIEGFNKVFVDNTAVKDILTDPSSLVKGDRIVIEVTPQLLNRHPEFVQQLSILAKTFKTVFLFDEAHFAEQTDKTQAIISTIVENDNETENEEKSLNAEITEMLKSSFNAIPWIYLTASPDTQSLRTIFSVDNNNYYELTKEDEIDLFISNPADFNYKPVINTLFIMDRLLDSVFDSKKAQRQDYTSLFTQRTARKYAQKFVLLSLTKSLEIINKGPADTYMQELYFDKTYKYAARAQNVNLLIKVPVNNSKTNKSGKTVAQNVKDLIEAVEADILNAFPAYTSIEILDATLTNQTSQEQANRFFASHPTSINIILTQQRLIEGTTLPELDGFLYYCTSKSLVKYKQESGRTLTPADNKRFGYIFFFDEDGLANVKALLQAKINKYKKKKHGPKKLTTEEANRLTRILPAFLVGDNEMKQIDYSRSLYTKSELESKRTSNTLFDKEILFSIAGLKELIWELLGKDTRNTTKRTNLNQGNGQGCGNGMPHKPKITPDTPNTEITIEKFVSALIYSYQDCIQNNVPVENLSDPLRTVFDMNSVKPEALELLYNNDYTKEVLVGTIYQTLVDDQDEINKKAMAYDA